MYSIKSLPISGYRHEPLKHTFFQQDGETQHVAIVLPGMGYTCQMPLLYYPTKLLLERGADVLWVEYAYHQRPDFQSLSGREQVAWLLGDVKAACNAALAMRVYQQITLVGKSLGTLAMGHLIGDARFKDADCIWLTPLLRNERLIAQIEQNAPRSLFVIGTADPVYDAAHLADVKAATESEAVVIEGANHSMEIEGHTERSLDALVQIMRAVQSFLH